MDGPAVGGTCGGACGTPYLSAFANAVLIVGTATPVAGTQLTNLHAAAVNHPMSSEDSCVAACMAGPLPIASEPHLTH